jgi:ABC-type multidrug transport system fused ATPase/permease subunit
VKLLKTKTKTKTKLPYSLMSNLGYTLRWNLRESPSTVVWSVVGIIARVAAPFAGILMPKIVIDALTGGYTSAQFIAAVGGFALLLAAFSFLQAWGGYKIDFEFGTLNQTHNCIAMTEKQTDMDYELLSDPEVKKIEQKVWLVLDSQNTPGNKILYNAADTLVQILGLALFGGVIVSVHWALLPLIVLSAVIVSLMTRRANKYEESVRAEGNKAHNKLWHSVRRLLDDALAKDLRLFDMIGWIQANIFKAKQDSERIGGGTYKRRTQTSVVSAILVLLRDGAAYALLIYLLLNDALSLGDFVLMFAAVGAFAGWVQGVITGAGELSRSHAQLCGFREYIDLPDKWNRGKGKPLPPLDEAPELTLENVCYTYPGSDAPALENINLTIRKGERLAVVGVNGAGKTTLIKLLSGMLFPTSGVVRLNGTDIREFNRDEYYTMFTAVFQNISVQPTSIAENIAQQPLDKIDKTRLARCLELSGLTEKIESLPDGGNTLLVRIVEPDAVELSGGETQKLALARALYKHAPIILLDEPTAALDPIAESEMYGRYAELTKGKTSVYISHRLASTRFCDRIIMLDGQSVSEIGNHDELMKRGGKYAEMFAVQASYYKSDKSDKSDKSEETEVC